MSHHLESVFRSYSIIFFTESKWIGLVLLLATFFAPVYGAFGLAGVLVALGAAHLLEFDPKIIKTGAYTFNSLLTCMALAYLSHFQWDLTWSDGLQLSFVHLVRMLSLIVCFSLVAFFVTLLLGNMLQVHFGLPAMSLPFVASAALLYFLFYSFSRTPIASIDPDFILPKLPVLPPVIQTFFESFGAIFFLPNVVIGLIVFGCLLTSSRLMVIYATAAFIAGIGFLKLFGYQITSAELAWIGFNFLFSGMVLGGVFFIPSRSSIPVAMISAFFCAALAIAFRTLFWNFNIPPLALPFNLVVLSIVYSLNLRPKVSWLFTNPFPDGNPELNFWRFHSQRVRFPDALEPSVQPPFQGERVITQGFSGEITHVGDYCHALDFEIIDDKGKKHTGPGSALADFLTFGSDVLSPGDGTVVRVIDHVKDNPIGRNNLVENWGNLVVLLLDSGVSIQISHFKKKGVLVQEGQRVTRGMLLGYCGNSGRSPVPHLHFQAQQAAVIGSKTIPFGLRNYISVHEDGYTFEHHGIPVLGERIRSMEVEPLIASIFSELPGEYRFKLETGEIEEISCKIDSSGNYIFESDQKSTLSARIMDGAFHCLDYDGGGANLLALVRLCLGRVPFSALKGLVWSDQVSVRPFMKDLHRLNLEIVAPFAGYDFLKTSSKISSIEDSVVTIKTSIENPKGNAPEFVEIQIASGIGIKAIKSNHITAEVDT